MEVDVCMWCYVFVLEFLYIMLSARNQVLVSVKWVFLTHALIQYGAITGVSGATVQF
jgi:hypothetical protein